MVNKLESVVSAGRVLAGFLRSEQALLLCLRLAVCSLFLGRGILYLSNFAPLSVFFWNQSLLEEPLERWFDLAWVDYAATSEPLILGVQDALGVLFLICAIVCWLVPRERHRWARWVVYLGMIGLIPYWLLKWVDTNYQVPMFMEHFLQWGTPLLLLLYRRLSDKWWYALAWLLVSLTFIGHGHYAIGLGVPHNNDFVNMCIKLLGTDVAGARLFLNWVGWIDLALPFLILVPRIRIPALIYTATWGLATAFARIFSHYTPAEDYYGLHPWVAEAVVRFTHGLSPLAMLIMLLYFAQRKKDNKIISIQTGRADEQTVTDNDQAQSGGV